MVMFTDPHIQTHKLKPDLSASTLADIPTTIQLKFVGVELHLQKTDYVFLAFKACRHIHIQ